MADEVFRRLLDELARIQFDGRVSYHFYNEPLLRRDLEKLVKQVSARLPDAFQVLFTNGEFLTDERYNSLLEAGIESFLITSHTLAAHPARPFQTVAFPNQIQLTNRGGTMINLPKAGPDIQSLRCYAPSEMLIVTVTGDVVLCYEDARREYIMGNILESALEDIWLSEEFVRIRQLVAEGRRAEATAICHLCSNQVHQIPGTSHIPT